MHEHDTLSISPRSLQARVWPWRNRSASEVAAVIEQPRFIHSFARGSGCALDFCSAHSPAAGPLPAQTVAMSGKTKKNRKKGVAHRTARVEREHVDVRDAGALAAPACARRAADRATIPPLLRGTHDAGRDGTHTPRRGRLL